MLQFNLPTTKPNNQANKAPIKKNNVFGSMKDDDDELEIGKKGYGKHAMPLVAAEQSKLSYQKMLDETSKYILEDPDIFAYDAHYDKTQELRKDLEEQKKQKKVGAKYITNIQKTADKRKIEQSLIYEKIAEKELQREDQKAGGQKYLTASYKRMMEQGRQFLEEDAKKEEFNKVHGATNDDNLGGLYKNLYQSDIFAGGYRPDLGSIMKQEANPKPVAQGQAPPSQPTANQAAEPTANPEQNPAEVQQAQPAGGILPDREEKKAADARPAREERRNKKGSISRSRSRSKSPRVSAPKEEAKEAKEEVKLSREEKIRQAKERAQQRKANKPAPVEEK